MINELPTLKKIKDEHNKNILLITWFNEVKKFIRRAKNEISIKPKIDCSHKWVNFSFSFVLFLTN